MANWFYYGADGRKFGQVSAEQLKALAESGAIMPDTVIESESGQQAYAEHTRGLFAEPAKKKVEPPPMPPMESGYQSRKENHMTDWFYYDAFESRNGPYSVEQMQRLVQSGIVRRDTVVEPVGGERRRAADVDGLVFVVPPPLPGEVPKTPPVVKQEKSGDIPVPLENFQNSQIGSRISRRVIGGHPEKLNGSEYNIWAKWSLGTRIIVASAVLAAISFIMPWRSLGPFSVNAFQNGAFLLGLLFAYPVWAAVSGRAVNRVGGLTCGGVGFVLGILFIIDSQITFFDETMNAAGGGVYVFLLSCIALGVGVYLHRAAENADISLAGVQSKLTRPVFAAGVGLALLVVIIAACSYYFAGDRSEELSDSPFSADETTEKKRSPQEEMKTLEKKKANAHRAKGFIVENPKFYHHEGMFTQAVIELDIRNDTRETIAGFSLACKLLSPGRSVPWVEDDIAYKIAGGLEPGESKNLKLSAGYEWDNAPKDRKDYVLQVTVKSIQFADGEKIKADTFTKDDEQRLQELKRK